MRVKCVGTKRIRQRLHVVVETISGETDALTDIDRGKHFDLPVSRSLEKRDVNLHRAIQLQEPTPVTLQDLVPLCVIQKPFREEARHRHVKVGERRGCCEDKRARVLGEYEAGYAGRFDLSAHPCEAPEAAQFGYRRNRGADWCETEQRKNIS